MNEFLVDQYKLQTGQEISLLPMCTNLGVNSKGEQEWSFLRVILSCCQQTPCHQHWCCQPCRSLSSSEVQFVQVLPMKLLLHLEVATPKGLQTCLLSCAASPQRIISI